MLKGKNSIPTWHYLGQLFKFAVSWARAHGANLLLGKCWARMFWSQECGMEEKAASEYLNASWQTNKLDNFLLNFVLWKNHVIDVENEHSVDSFALTLVKLLKQPSMPANRFRYRGLQTRKSMSVQKNQNGFLILLKKK